MIAVLLALPILAGAWPAGVESEIATPLTEFLAKVDDPAMHDRFWAYDLV